MAVLLHSTATMAEASLDEAALNFASAKDEMSQMLDAAAQEKARVFAEYNDKFKKEMDVVQLQLEQLGKNLHEKERKWIADTTKEKAVAKYMKVVAATREETPEVRIGGTRPRREVSITARTPPATNRRRHRGSPDRATTRRSSRRVGRDQRRSVRQHHHSEAEPDPARAPGHRGVDGERVDKRRARSAAPRCRRDGVVGSSGSATWSPTHTDWHPSRSASSASRQHSLAWSSGAMGSAIAKPRFPSAMPTFTARPV